jgi:hypothetical protein
MEQWCDAWKKAKPRTSNTLGGSYSPPYAAESTCFGDISYDPDLLFLYTTIIAVHSRETASTLLGAPH